MTPDAIDTAGNISCQTNLTTAASLKITRLAWKHIKSSIWAHNKSQREDLLQCDACRVRTVNKVASLVLERCDPSIRLFSWQELIAIQGNDRGGFSFSLRSNKQTQVEYWSYCRREQMGYVHSTHLQNLAVHVWPMFKCHVGPVYDITDG